VHGFAAADKFAAAALFYYYNITADLTFKDLPLFCDVYHPEILSVSHINRKQQPRSPVFLVAGTPGSHPAVLVPGKKNMRSDVTLAAFWRVLYIFRSLDVRADMGHREALVLFAGAGRTFPEVLFALVECKFLSAIYADILAGPDFLSCSVRRIFGQIIHQTSYSRHKFIWVAFIFPFHPLHP
jgi:hypothetical protein